VEQATRQGTSDARARPAIAGRLLAGGTGGNELLTSVTGAALLALLAVIGVTILNVRSLLWVHLFVGLVLIGPLALKIGSTGYRFVRYYTSDPAYVRKGTPPTALRLIAPIVVITTVIVMASGVALLIGGPGSRGTFLPIHKVSFIVWVVFMSVHVLGHLPELARAMREEYGTAAQLGGVQRGRAGRSLALASALTLGAVTAVLCVPAFAAWLNAPHHH
jgi:hypothetical protein